MENFLQKWMILSLFFLVTFITTSRAQSTINADEIKTQLIADWKRAKDYTNEYLNAMPAGKYSFKAVDSIRSFAQQMLHLAQANLFFLGTATGVNKNFGRNLEQTPSAWTADSVKYFVNSSYDFAIDAV